MSVLAGVRNSAVWQEGRGLELLDSEYRKKMNGFDAFFSNKNDFRSYRSVLRDVSVPVIPYLGVLLNDISSLSQSPSEFSNDLIDFKKCKSLYSLMENLSAWQAKSHSFEIIPCIQVWSFSFPISSIFVLKELRLFTPGNLC